MRVTLIRDLPPSHKKGSTHQVTPAVGARLIRKGAAKDVSKTKENTDDKSDGN